MQARKIVKTILFGKLNPYVSLRLKNQAYKDEYATKTIPMSNNPVWNEEFNIISSEKDYVLVINMSNENTKQDEELMDQLEFLISQLSAGGNKDRKILDMKLKKKVV